MQDQREQAQLIHDKETGEYLKYHQLIRDPKYKETWSQSTANEFGRLTQGVGGRFKGTNCRKLPSYVPYKGTYVPYDGTFGAPDQGQTLDV